MSFHSKISEVSSNAKQRSGRRAVFDTWGGVCQKKLKLILLYDSFRILATLRATSQN